MTSKHVTELVSACLSKITLSNQTINAFSHVRDSAVLLELARQADDRWNKGTQKSRIDGLPIIVKDNICTQSSPTTCASKILSGSKSPFDATVVERLEAAGCIVLGKGNMDEFGMGSYGLHSSHGPVKNPISLDRVAGGSSSGSAAAVAAGMALAGLGSDTGGSVRLPASYCGLYGFKPSYGRFSRRGLVAYASSLDTVGILANSVDHIEGMFDVMDGLDEQDVSTREFKPNQHQQTEPSKITVGIPQEYHVDGLSHASLQAWSSAIEKLQSKGVNIKLISLPHTSLALPAYYILAPAEASSNLARYDGVRYGMPNDGSWKSFLDFRSVGFGDEVKRRIILGTFVLSSKAYGSYFQQAQKLRTLISKDFDDVFAKSVDFVLTPAAISSAPSVESATKEGDESVVREYVNDVMTIPASLAGLPAIVVPLGSETHSHGPNGTKLPVGVQLIGSFGADPMLFGISRLLSN